MHMALRFLWEFAVAVVIAIVLAATLIGAVAILDLLGI